MRLLLCSLFLAAPLAAQDAPPPVKLPSTEGMDPEVVSHLEALIATVEATPGDAELHADLGLAYEANTIFEPAAQCYRNVIAMLPDRPEWRYRLGVMLTDVFFETYHSHRL